MNTSPPHGISADDWQQTLLQHGYDPQPTVSSALWRHWQQLGLSAALNYHAADVLVAVIERKLKDPLAVLKATMIRHQQSVQLGKAAPELAPEHPQTSPCPFGRGDLVWLSNAPETWGPADANGAHPAQVISQAQHTLTVWPIGEGSPLHLDLRERPVIRAATREEISPDWMTRRQHWLDTNNTPSLQAPAESHKAARAEPTAKAARPARTPRPRSSSPLINLRLQFGGYLPGAAAELGGPPSWLQLPEPDFEAHLNTRKTAPRWSALMNTIERDAHEATTRQAQRTLDQVFKQERSA